MKMRGLVTVLIFAAVSSFAVAEEKAEAAGAPDRELGYAMGFHFGSQMEKELEFFKTKNLAVDVSRFTKGLGDAIEKKTPEMTEEAIEAQLKAFGEKMQAAAAETAKAEEANPEAAKTEEVKIEVAEDKELGYAIGFKFGGQMERQLGFFRTKGADLDVPGFLKGVIDAVEKKEPEQTEEQRRQVLQAFGNKMQAMATKENQDAGAAFLAENGKKEGVVTTASGLQYQVITAGTGAKPTATDKVKVHYQGTLINGTVFDSSRARGEPVTFAANQVIAGWTEALQLMPVGSTYKLAIPSNLAYGEQGAGQVIGPNATLIFDVELLEIVK